MGYIQEHPDFRTQGKTIEELKLNIKDIYDDIISGKIEIAHQTNIMELVV